ncbi:hypothetical protein M91_02325, partial [Bos mutus]
LQQEVSGLREEFRKQEARWAATHRELRAQMDALVKQNLELRAGLRASERRRLEAKRSAAGSVHVRRRSEARPISRETEKTDSGKPIPCEDGDKALSRSLQDRHAKPPRREQASEEKPAPIIIFSYINEYYLTLMLKNLQKWSGRRSPAPAALAVAPQDHRAKDDPGEPPRAGFSSCLLFAPRRWLLLSYNVTLSPQDLPVEPELPPNVSQHEDTKMKQEEEGEIQHPKDKGEQALSNSCKMDTFSKGTEKDVCADKTITPRRSNWDVKESPQDTRLVCFWCLQTHSAGAGRARTAHRRPLEVGRVPNKQTEKVCADGSKEIVFPDGTVQRLNDGREETVFPDGTIVSVERNGDKTIVLSNGQREIHTAQFKRREYPDGTTKTVYHDGHQETKDASGRVRVRDEAGNIVLDRK